MRELGFTRAWDKLEAATFTTFRFPRRDRDWQVGEVVKVVLYPRTPERIELGIARIEAKEPRRVSTLGWWSSNVGWGDIRGDIPLVSANEARADGFAGTVSMLIYLRKTYGERVSKQPMNKLTLLMQSQSDVRSAVSPGR